jgi:hypothetical protein
MTITAAGRCVGIGLSVGWLEAGQISRFLA